MPGGDERHQLIHHLDISRMGAEFDELATEFTGGGRFEPSGRLHNVRGLRNQLSKRQRLRSGEVESRAVRTPFHSGQGHLGDITRIDERNARFTDR